MANNLNYTGGGRGSGFGAPAKPATSAAQGDLLKGAMGMVATSAIGAWASYTMDKINTKRKQSAFDHARTMARIGRNQRAWQGAVARDRMKEAQAVQSIALEVKRMEQTAKLESGIQDLQGATADRIRAINSLQSIGQAEELERSQILDRASLAEKVASGSALGIKQTAERQTSGFEQVGSVAVDALRIGKAAFGKEEGSDILSKRLKGA